MAELILLASMNGRRVAFPADRVEAVVELEGIVPVPGAAAHVAGLSALRSRVLTVIDCLAALELGASRLEGPLEAIVIPTGGHGYALLVDRVEDVIEAAAPAQPSRAPLGPGWDRIASGLIEAGGELLLLADPDAIVAGPAAKIERAA